jgi:hypothetical protein
MTEYVRIEIKKSTLEKLEKMQGEYGSLASVIEVLVDSVGGVRIEDIKEMKRESVALELNYSNFDFNTRGTRSVTYHELKLAKTGDRIYAAIDPLGDRYAMDIAEILFVDDRSVFVRVTQLLRTPEGENSIVHMEHFDLF